MKYRTMVKRVNRNCQTSHKIFKRIQDSHHNLGWEFDCATVSLYALDASLRKRYPRIPDGGSAFIARISLKVSARRAK